MNADSFAYDVAFSFLTEDEPLALQLNDRLQDRVKTFIYSEQQKVVAGTDGEETFHRVFGKEARIVVVLYRTGWGESRWTRVERTAIRNRGNEHGYGFAVFIPLEAPPKVPPWLPTTQVWVDLNRFGIDAAAAVIDARIRDAGGQVHQETVEEHAHRIERAIRFTKRREQFQWDEGVKAAQGEINRLKEALESRAEIVRKATSIQLAVRQTGKSSFYLVGLGRALGIAWNLKAANHLGDAFLLVVLFNHPPAGRGEFQWESPHRIRSMRFVFDLLPSEVGGWILDDEQRRTFSTDLLAEYLVKNYLEHGRPS